MIFPDFEVVHHPFLPLTSCSCRADQIARARVRKERWCIGFAVGMEPAERRDLSYALGNKSDRVQIASMCGKYDRAIRQVDEADDAVRPIGLPC